MLIPDFTLSKGKPFFAKPIKATKVSVKAASKNAFELRVILRFENEVRYFDLSKTKSNHTFSKADKYEFLDFEILKGDDIDIYISIA